MPYLDIPHAKVRNLRSLISDAQGVLTVVLHRQNAVTPRIALQMVDACATNVLDHRKKALHGSVQGFILGWIWKDAAILSWPALADPQRAGDDQNSTQPWVSTSQVANSSLQIIMIIFELRKSSPQPRPKRPQTHEDA